MKEINKLCKRTKQIKHFLLIYNFLFFFFFLLCLVVLCWKGPSILKHTHTEPNKPTRGQNGVYQTPADANQLVSRGELKTMPITPDYLSCFKSF